MVAPAVSSLSPADAAQGTPRDSTISFDITGADNVDLSSLNVDINIGSMTQKKVPSDLAVTRAATTDGTSRFHFSGANGVMAYTDDVGDTFVTVSTGLGNNIFGIAHDGASTVVGCGDFNGLNDVVLSTNNGVGYSLITSASSTNWRGATHGGGLFVIVGAGEAIDTSPAGTTWTNRSAFSSGTFRRVDYSSGTGTYITVGDGGRMGRSTNGTSWTKTTPFGANAMRDVANDGASTWVAVGGNGIIYYSTTDGASWTQAATDLFASPQGLDMRLEGAIHDGTRFIVSGRSFYGVSTDGISWTFAPVQGGQNLIALATVGGDYVLSVNELYRTTSIVPTTESIVSAGAVQAGYTGSVSSISQGYNVSVTRDTDFSRGTQGGLFITADSTLADTMDRVFASYWFPDASLRQTFKDSLGLSGATSGGGNVTVATMQSREISPTHRHLVFSTAISHSFNSLNEFAVYLDGVEQTKTRGRLQNGGITTNLYQQHQSMSLITPALADNLTFQVNTTTNGGAPQTATAQHRMCVFDIDSDPDFFNEGVAFFVDEDTTTQTNMDTTFTNNVGASVTFTPDGSNDYIVLFGVRATSVAADGSAFFDARVTDSVDGDLGVRVGTGRVVTSQDQEFCRMGAVILSAPAATSRTLQIEMVGDNVFDHDNSVIFVANVGSFFQAVASQSTSVQSGFGTSDTQVDTQAITSGPTGEDVFFVFAQVDPTTGLGGRLQLDYPAASNIWTSALTDNATDWIIAGADPAGDRSNIMAIECVNRNPSDTLDVSFAADSGVVELERRTLFSMSNFVQELGATKVTTPDPADAATGVALDKVLGWTPGFDNQSFNPYFGTMSGSLNPYRNQEAQTFNPGVLAPNQTYYWRIDAVDSGSGVVTGDEWSFTTGGLGSVTGHNPANSATGVATNQQLSWSALVGASYYKLYTGPSAGALVFRQDVTGTSADLGPWGTDNTVFWRVDAVAADGTTIDTGTVVSFDTVGAPDSTDSAVLDTSGTQKGTGIGTAKATVRKT